MDKERLILYSIPDFLFNLSSFYQFFSLFYKSLFSAEKRALIKKCNNALYPDLYGHYREAKFTQTKHHWWWKANRVFNELEVTRFHSGKSDIFYTKKLSILKLTEIDRTITNV